MVGNSKQFVLLEMCSARISTGGIVTYYFPTVFATTPT